MKFYIGDIIVSSISHNKDKGKFRVTDIYTDITGSSYTIERLFDSYISTWSANWIEASFKLDISTIRRNKLNELGI